MNQLSPAQLTALEAAADAAIGRQEMRCQHAMADLYKAAGLLPDSVEIPEGPRGHSRYSGHSLITEWLENSPCFTRRAGLPSVALAEEGDLLVFRLGHADHHVGILLGAGRLVHVFGTHGVQVAPCIPAPWVKRIGSIWRLA